MKPNEALIFMMVMEAMENNPSSYARQNMDDFVEIPLPEYSEKKKTCNNCVSVSCFDCTGRDKHTFERE